MEWLIRASSRGQIMTDDKIETFHLHFYKTYKRQIW